MGIIKRGILGGFRNTTGAVVGVRWRGLDVMRGRPRKNSKTFSQTQLDQQKKLSLLSHVLSKASTLINIGFAESQATETPMNRAMAYNLKNPLAGLSPNLQLYYPTLSFSHGPRALPKTASIEG